ncbi:MAG: hypothetical protein LCH41_12960 [Armatimonadetes bacterium]|nr:hypothetical protein [Armatimonadota bacterium]
MSNSSEHLQSDSDVEAILGLAMEKSGTTTSLRDRLQATAQELGISPEALAEAEEEYRQAKAEEIRRTEEEARAAAEALQAKRTLWRNIGIGTLAVAAIVLILFVLDATNMGKSLIGLVFLTFWAGSSRRTRRRARRS